MEDKKKAGAQFFRNEKMESGLEEDM